MRTIRITISLLSILATLACSPRAHAPGALGSLSPAESDEVDAAESASRCYCERVLAVDVDGGGVCSTLPSGAVHASLPASGSFGGADRNGCASAQDVEGRGGTPPAGFCRADFDYCMASELRLRADSFARAPSTRAVRDTLLERARDAFGRSAVESAATLAMLDQLCPGATYATLREYFVGLEDDDGIGEARAAAVLAECGRLTNPATAGYAAAASARIADSVAQLADTLEITTRSAAAVSDAIALGRTSGTEITRDLWGPDSARMRALGAVFGSGPVYADRRAGHGPYAARWRDSAHAQQALELLLRHRVPVTYVTCTRNADVILGTTRAWQTTEEFSDTLGADYVLAAYNYLDHRLAAAAYIAPFGTTAEGTALRTTDLPNAAAFRAYATESLPASVSPLRRLHSLRPEHIRDAAELLADLATTMAADLSVEFLFTTPATIDGHQSTCVVHAASLHSDIVGQRPRELVGRMLAHADDTWISIGSDYRVVLPDEDPLYVSSSSAPNTSEALRLRNWYRFDPDLLAQVGAAGTLHQLRHNLLRIVASQTTMSDTEAIGSALRVIDGYIGDVWTEHTVDAYLSPCPTLPHLCAAYGWCGCIGEPSGVVDEETHVWSIYFRPEDHPELNGEGAAAPELVAVASERDVFCLVRGHHIEDPRGSECPMAVAPLEERLFAPGARVVSRADYFGFRRRTYTLPEWIPGSDLNYGVISLDQPVYILLRVPHSAQNPGGYRLIDAITHTRSAEVHAFGGQLGDLFAAVSAKDPSNPAAPAMTSLDLPYDLIPPLENELIDDSDGFEDSWDRYLQQAVRGAQRASVLASAARQHEIEMLRSDRATAAQIELAALAEQEVVAEQCGALGDDGSCTGERISSIALTALIPVAPAPGAEPRVDPSGQRVIREDQQISPPITGGEITYDFRLRGAGHVVPGSVQLHVREGGTERTYGDAHTDGKLYRIIDGAPVDVETGTVDYATGRVLFHRARTGGLDAGSVVLASYTPLAYDRRYPDAYERALGPDALPARPLTCTEFIDNLPALFNIPQISQCDASGDDADLISTILGGTSAANAFCRLAAEDGDGQEEIAIALACAAFPFPAGLLGICGEEQRAGYRGRLGDYLRGYLGDALRCADWVVRDQLHRVELAEVPERVVDAFVAGEEPVYSDVGGLVRQEFIAAHQALDDMRESIRDFEMERDAAAQRAEYAALYTDYTASDATEQTLCLSGNIMQTVGSVWGGFQSFGGGGGGGALGSIGAGWENSSQTRRGCIAGDVAAFSQGHQAFVDALNSVEAMRESAVRARGLAAAFAAIDGRLDTIERRVRIAAERRQITERLAANTVYSDPSWRALQGLEARRARSAIRRAQQQAFIARRAIEFRLATDLRTMSVAEPFVEAPASWVNDVFTLDTETIEQSTSPFLPSTGGTVSTAGEAIEDYVQNLEDFVSGYPFARRFSEGEDVAVLNLAALARTIDPAVCPELCGTGTEQRVYRCDFAPEAWLPGGFEVGFDGSGLPMCPAETPMPCGGHEHVLAVRACSEGAEAPGLVDALLFKCSGWDALLPGGTPLGTPRDVEPCGDHDGDGRDQLGEVEYVLYTFAIPEPAGAYFEGRLAIGSYNYRLDGVSLNVVGSGLYDCSRAVRPSECYGDGNLQYSLTQASIVSLESFEGERLSYFMEPGRIVRARALAAERYLTNPLSSADRALLSGYERREWWGRPVAGVYTLVLHSRPEIVWSRLDDIQVLLRYDYWTRQR